MIPLFKVYMFSRVDAPLLEVLHSGYIGQEKKVGAFEEVLKEHFNNDYVVVLNNGTSIDINGGLNG